MGCLTAVGFFLRFWRQSNDRLFAAFAIAFGLLAANWVGLAEIAPRHESRHYIYVLRLMAFTILLVGILDKNRRPRDSV